MAADIPTMGAPTRAPVILRGLRPIAEHLRIQTRYVAHLERTGKLPTFRLSGDSAPHATAGGLDEWRQIVSASAEGC